MIIWKDVPVVIKEKVPHIHKIGKKIHNDFCTSFGDIPVARFNEITKKWEEIENRRGIAYAARKRLKYRKRE